MTWDTAQHGTKRLGGVKVLIGAQALSGMVQEPSAAIDLSRMRGSCESPRSD